MLKAKIICVVVYCLFLYGIAWISAIGYREDDAFLGVNRSQWHALFVACMPILIIFVK